MNQAKPSQPSPSIRRSPPLPPPSSPPTSCHLTLSDTKKGTGFGLSLWRRAGLRRLCGSTTGMSLWCLWFSYGSSRVFLPSYWFTSERRTFPTCIGRSGDAWQVCVAAGAPPGLCEGDSIGASSSTAPSPLLLPAVAPGEGPRGFVSAHN